MGLDEGEPGPDHDECPGTDQFPSTFHSSASVSVGLDQVYVLSLSRVGDKLVAGLDTDSLSVHSLDTLVRQDTLRGHTNSVTGVAGCEASPRLVYSSSRDQTVRVWDLREGGKCVHTLKDTSDKGKNSGPPVDQGRPLTCLSVSGQTVVAGTEQVGVDSFLLFWDMRNTVRLAGGYWDSHSDDITTVTFNPSNKDSLATGSTDGLVNVFDLSESDEDSALVTSHNTEDSVSGLVWYSRKQESRYLAILTHTESVQLWDTEAYSPYTVLTRGDVTHGIRRAVAEHCYIAGLHPREGDDGMVMVAGSRYSASPALRLATVRNKKVKPLADLPGGCGVVR